MSSSSDAAGGDSGASHYFPYHRNEKYPRSLKSDFKKLKISTLKKYVQQFNINVRPDCTPVELSVAVAR